MSAILESEFVFEDERPFASCHAPNEFSYPAVVVDGTAVLVTYTWKREKIRFRRVEL